MELSDYIITYQSSGKIVANLFDYYERYIRHLDKRFEQYSYYDNRLVLCWFKDHEDINPSMGFIYDRRFKGVQLYHCFGCGRTGNVVRLNQLVESQYHGRELTVFESCMDLAEKFGIPVDEFRDVEEDDYEARYSRSFKRIDELVTHYTEREFKEALLTMRKSGVVDLNKLNSECVKMIATSKQLYD